MRKDKNRSPLDRQRRDTGAPLDDAIEAQVLEAARSLGWTVPQSEEEVAAAERRWAGRAVPLPDAIRDPAPGALGGRSPVEGRQPASPIQFPVSQDVETMLARAAREGKAVSPQIEERMRRDRKAAEERIAKAKNGEDEPRDGPDVR